MSEKGNKQDSQAKNKMLHRTMFVPMVELIVLLFFSLSCLFSSNVRAVTLTKLL